MDPACLHPLRFPCPAVIFSLSCFKFQPGFPSRFCVSSLHWPASVLLLSLSPALAGRRLEPQLEQLPASLLSLVLFPAAHSVSPLLQGTAAGKAARMLSQQVSPPAQPMISRAANLRRSTARTSSSAPSDTPPVLCRGFDPCRQRPQGVAVDFGPKQSSWLINQLGDPSLQPALAAAGDVAPSLGYRWTGNLSLPLLVYRRCSCKW